MTSRDLVLLMFRRWYLVVAGTGVTLAVASTIMTTSWGVYWTELSVLLVSPTSDELPNQLEESHNSLAPLAGVIVVDFNGTHRPMLTSSSETTLFGEGQRSGVMVRMPNQGNQWQPAYVTPIIDVQVVDSTPGAVALQAQRVTAELKDLLAKRQDAMGVLPSMRVSMIVSPVDPPIIYIAGSRPRALGAIGLLGSALTVISVYWLERLRDRKRRQAPGTMQRNGSPLVLSQGSNGGA